MLLIGEPLTSFIDYKKISLYIPTARCTFKCVKDGEKNGQQVKCQNHEYWDSVKNNLINISPIDIIEKYVKTNPFIESIILSGLDPIDSFEEILDFIITFRKEFLNKDIIIYTGYDEDEITDKIDKLKNFKNIYIKFGRYKPWLNKKVDKIGGITLISNNQYFKKIS